MRSRADLRHGGEWLLRATLVAVLAFAQWQSMRRVETRAGTRRVSSETLDAEVTRALTTKDRVAFDLSVTATLSRADRDVLVALRRAGLPVRWHGDVPPLALQVARDREPDARARLLLVGGGPDAVSLTDSAGPLETVRAATGTTVDVGTLVGAVRARRGRFEARSAVLAATPPRAVLVLGRAGWESKFVMSALTESGWTVRARIPTAPGIDVRDDALFPLDTARYDAVVALDSSAADVGPAIVKFVADGGGLVVGASALAIGPLRPLVPARASDRRAGRILLANDTVTTADLPLRPLATLRSDALSLRHEAAGPVLVARRAGLGRVLAVGYDESWRWRMLGGTSGLAAHRAWWSRAVGSVAPERAELPIATGVDAAPRAALIDALGPSSPGDVTGAHAPDRARLPFILLIVAAAALLAETASRRFRGER